VNTWQRNRDRLSRGRIRWYSRKAMRDVCGLGTACSSLVPIVAVLATMGCTTFANVRSAQVRPGPSATVEASLAGAPGEASGWFWNADCFRQCSQPVVGADLVFAYGSRPVDGSPYALGFGTSGPWPFVEGYWQLGKSAEHPFGVGARADVPVGGCSERQIYGRTDFLLDKDTRLLWNPGVLYHVGRNGDGTGSVSFIGLVQGIGLERDFGPIVLTPSAALVIGHGQRTTLNQSYGPQTRAFATAALSITLGGSRE